MTKEEMYQLFILGKTVSFIKDGNKFIENARMSNINDEYVTINDSNWVWCHDLELATVKQPLNLDPKHLNLGSDPEFFFTDKEGKVIPSHLVIKTESKQKEEDKVIRDGFQGELNPSYAFCRQSAGVYIAYTLRKAQKMAKDANASISFKLGHIIPDDVWKNTPKEMKVFGCSPTLNVYEKKFKRVSGFREKFRAGGGHIHFSLDNTQKDNIETIVKLMDIVAGNTCVLIDRDPDNARRRKNYGRAGEYRIKPYGVEYRVLSNFWLKSYTLWSMASVLLRNAVAIFTAGKAEEFISLFDMKKVRKAINENDFELAKENFLILSDFLKKNQAYNNGLSTKRIDKFFKWATSKDPLKEWDTSEKSLNSWEDKIMNSGIGFEKFIDSL